MSASCRHTHLLRHDSIASGVYCSVEVLVWGRFREPLPTDVSCMPGSAAAASRLPKALSISHRERRKSCPESERGSCGSRKASAPPAGLRRTSENSSPQESAHNRLSCSVGHRFERLRWLAATTVHPTVDLSQPGKDASLIIGVVSAAGRHSVGDLAAGIAIGGLSEKRGQILAGHLAEWVAESIRAAEEARPTSAPGQMRSPCHSCLCALHHSLGGELLSPELAAGEPRAKPANAGASESATLCHVARSGEAFKVVCAVTR